MKENATLLALTVNCLSHAVGTIQYDCVLVHHTLFLDLAANSLSLTAVQWASQLQSSVTVPGILSIEGGTQYIIREDAMYVLGKQHNAN